MCLLCLYRFSELLEAVWGDILFNGRSDVLSRTGFTLALLSHRPLNRKSPQTASRSSEKWQKHSKHTTGNGLQTVFRFLGILHGKLTTYILDQISAPYKQFTLRFG